MSKQIERIEKMEKYLNEAREAADKLDEALEAYEKTLKKYRELDKYYTSHLWMKDFEDYEEGKLPKDLKCGVLSEDAVYDLLTDNRELAMRMYRIIGEHLNNM